MIFLASIVCLKVSRRQGLQDKVRELCWGFARQKWQDMGRLEMKNKKQGK